MVGYTVVGLGSGWIVLARPHGLSSDLHEPTDASASSDNFGSCRQSRIVDQATLRENCGSRTVSLVCELFFILQIMILRGLQS
jgi:hypothetical protein